MLWQDFLDCARRYVHGTTEADWRSAVSRAYYAIFHHFREWLLNCSLDLGKAGQAHANLYFGLFNCGESRMAQVARDIDFLRTQRFIADYDLRLLLKQKTAQGLISHAEKILTDCQTTLRVVPAQQIADGAKNYLISVGRIANTP